MAEEQPIKPEKETTPGVGAQGAVAPQPPTTDPGVFSLEDLDKIIESEDPNFKKEIEALKAHKMELTADNENLGVKTDDEHLTKDEHEHTSARRVILQKLFINPYRRAWTFVRMQGTALLNRSRHFLLHAISFVRNELPDRIKYYRSRLKEYWGVAKKFVADVRALSRVQKAAIVFIFLTSVGAIFFMSKTLTGQWLPHYEDNMPRSLVKSAGFVHAYGSKKDLQDLFLAFPEVEYYVLLKKVVVNLRPSESSGSNPMGALEIYVGVDTQDTAIEVKDREQEIVDITQRALEGFSYDDSASRAGKSRMKEVVRDRINAILNQGHVFNIYFNSFVIYSGS